MMRKLDPEREKELIDKIAFWLIDRELGGPAVFALEMFKPITFIQSQIAAFWVAPLLDSFAFPSIEEGLSFFQRRENIERLMKRIEELQEEKREKESKERELLEKKRVSIIRRIRNAFKG